MSPPNGIAQVAAAVASPSAAWAGFEQMPESLSSNPQLLGAASKVTLFGVDGKVRFATRANALVFSPPPLVWRCVPSVG
jgi:hypothetical protein